MASGFSRTHATAVLLDDEQDIEEMKLDGEEFLIMREDEVLAVVETG